MVGSRNRTSKSALVSTIIINQSVIKKNYDNYKRHRKNIQVGSCFKIQHPPSPKSITQLRFFDQVGIQSRGNINQYHACSINVIGIQDCGLWRSGGRTDATKVQG